MRRVVSYCKRHLAQESHLKDEKTEEELEGMKSTLSLKNWVSFVLPSVSERIKLIWVGS